MNISGSSKAIMYVLLVVAAVLSTAFSFPPECNKGPDYWCLNEDTAVKCNVLQFCRLKSNFQLKSGPAAPNPVLIELYYESLCPGCRMFIRDQLWPTWEKLMNSGVMDIKLYPYGNAREYLDQQTQRWVFTCQHGPVECQVNMIESCAIHHMAHPKVFMPYIHCVESDSPSIANAQQCAQQLGVEWGPIANCYNGTEGNHLMHELAVKTDALQPSHQYVPWIVANGEHTDAIQSKAQENLLKYVCDTYTGVKPHACRVVDHTPKHCMKDW